MFKKRGAWRQRLVGGRRAGEHLAAAAADLKAAPAELLTGDQVAIADRIERPEVDLAEGGGGDELRSEGEFGVVDRQGGFDTVEIGLDQQLPLEEGGAALVAVVGDAGEGVVAGGDHLAQASMSGGRAYFSTRQSAAITWLLRRSSTRRLLRRGSGRLSKSGVRSSQRTFPTHDYP